MFFNYYIISQFITFLTGSLLAVFVILKNKQGQKNIGFFIFSLSVAAWSLLYCFWMGFSTSAEEGLFWCRMFMLPCIIIPAGYLHLTVAFTETMKERKKLLIGSYLLCLFFFLSDLLTPYFVTEVRPMVGVAYWPMANVLNSFYWAYYAFCIIISGYFFAKKYKTSAGTEKLQLKYVMLSTLISFSAGSLNVLPWYSIPIPPFLNILNPTFVVVFAYAITRFRLMDIKIVIRNVLFYLGVAFLLYGFFYATAYIYITFFHGIFTSGGYLLGLFMAPFIGIMLYAFSGFLNNIINKYIFTSIYGYQQTIKQASQKLSHNINLNKVADAAISAILQTLKPKKIALLLVSTKKENSLETIKTIGYSENEISGIDQEFFCNFFQQNQGIMTDYEIKEMLKDSNQPGKRNLAALKEEMEKNNVSVCVPLITSGKLSGLVIFSDSKEKDSYTSEDFDFLTTLSHQTQLAIRNALLYKEIESKNKNLQEALDAKDDFIRIANHQLNTPLSIIKNAYSMIKSKSIPPKKGLDYLENGIGRISRVVDDFWSVLQTEGEIPLNTQKTSISPIVRNIVEEKERMLAIDKKEIKITIEKPAFNIPDVLCDPKQITNVVHNLLDNACFYTKDKGSIIISYEIADKSYLKLNIKDSGIGFSKEDRNKIGQKFYRAKNAIHTQPDGSGLGIYICKKLVEANKGTFFFKSDGEGLGSTFAFTLPTT